MTRKEMEKLGFSAPNKSEFCRHYHRRSFGYGSSLDFYVIEESKTLECYFKKEGRILKRLKKHYRAELDTTKIVMAINDFILEVNGNYKQTFNSLHYGNIIGFARTGDCVSLED